MSDSSSSVVLVVTVTDLADLKPGDVVVGYRPGNGKRGSLRVAEAVVVHRAEPDDPLDVDVEALRRSVRERIKGEPGSDNGDEEQ